MKDGRISAAVMADFYPTALRSLRWMFEHKHETWHPPLCECCGVPLRNVEYGTVKFEVHPAPFPMEAHFGGIETTWQPESVPVVYNPNNYAISAEFKVRCKCSSECSWKNTVVYQHRRRVDDSIAWEAMGHTSEEKHVQFYAEHPELMEV